MVPIGQVVATRSGWRINNFVKLLIVGVVLIVGGTSVGLYITTSGMLRGYDATAAQSGVINADELAGGINNMLLGTAIGLLVPFVGACLIVGGAIVYTREKKRDQLESTQEESG